MTQKMSATHSENRPLRGLAKLLAIGYATGAASLVQAQQQPATAVGQESDMLQEVVVTSTRRSENVQQVPQSVSVLTGEELSSRDIVSVEQYTSTVPGLSYNETGFGARDGLDLTIRGISNTRLADTTAGTGALTTGFYIDDVAVMPVDVYLYDIDRMEVLKGPQGTLFGQASMGGTVRIITQKPDSTAFSATAEGTGAATESGSPSSSIKGMLNLPVIEGQLAARLVAYNDDQGGWIDWFQPSLAAGGGKGPIPGVPSGFPNPITGPANPVSDVNGTRTYGGRLQVLYTPTDALTITPAYMWQDRRQGFSSFIERNLDEGYITQNYQPEPRDEQFSQSSVTINYAFPIATLTSVTARYDRNYKWRQDTTTFIADTYGHTASGGIPATSYLDFDFTTRVDSEELRLSSNNAKYVDWLVGAAYFDEARTDADLWLAPGFDETAAGPGIPGGGALGFVFSTFDTNSLIDRSIFGDITLKLFDQRLQFSGGLRHFWESYGQTGESTGALVGAVGTLSVAPPQGETQSGTSPRVSAKYLITPDQMVYATASKGFRAGGPGALGVNQTPACLHALSLAGVEPGAGFTSDSIWNYELGFKSTWDEGRLLTDIAAFYIDWKNLQQSLILNNYDVNCAGTVTTNGGAATSRGVELTLGYRPLKSLTISANGAYTKAVLGEQPAGSTAGTEGAPLQNAPKLQGTLSMQYDFPVLAGRYHSYIRGDEAYYGSQWSTQSAYPNPFDYVPSRALTNFRFGFQPNNARWTTEVFMNNALNREQIYGAQAYFGEPATNQALVGQPRTVGLRASFLW
jgi:outer membrane receptor protein involved in Fe transport